jgi:hypothetical protein
MPKSEAAELWLKQAADDGLERSTVRQYEQHVRLHILSFVGTTKLSEFNAARLAAYRSRLIKEGRSAAMVRGVSSSLGAIIGHAMANGKASVCRRLGDDMNAARACKSKIGPTSAFSATINGPHGWTCGRLLSPPMSP